MSIEEKFLKAAETFTDRQKIYGKNYIVYGKVMAKLFPAGTTLKTEDDFIRFGILTQIVGKLSRYTNQFKKGGHKDSIHDLGVYAFILEEVESQIKIKEEENDREPKGSKYP